jgi:hypothetical protein
VYLNTPIEGIQTAIDVPQKARIVVPEKLSRIRTDKGFRGLRRRYNYQKPKPKWKKLVK